MAAQFEDKMVSLKAVMELLAQMAQSKKNTAEDFDYGWSDEANAAANDYIAQGYAIEEVANEVYAHFNAEEIIAENFKINNGRSVLASVISLEGTIKGSRLVQERKATKIVAEINDDDVIIQLMRRGYAWDGKRWNKE